MENTDQSLIRETLAGNTQAFGKLVLAYQDFIYGCALRLQVVNILSDCLESQVHSYLEDAGRSSDFDIDLELCRPKLMNFLGSWYIKTGNSCKALECFRLSTVSVMEQSPSKQNLFYIRRFLSMLIDDERFEEAWTYLGRVNAEDAKDDPQMRVLFANIAIPLGMFDDAMYALNRRPTYISNQTFSCDFSQARKELYRRMQISHWMEKSLHNMIKAASVDPRRTKKLIQYVNENDLQNSILNQVWL